MGKKKSMKPASPTKLRNILVLRGTEDWKVWLDEVATANSAPLTVTVEQALKEYAAKLGVRKPPKRVP
jgi:trans-2-enoyl-CoA reductase